MHPLLKRLCSVLGLLACFGLRALAAEDLSLVADGQSEFQIVVGQTAIPSERYAAEQTQDLLREISGVTLPIITDAQPLPSHAILVGKGRWLETLGVKLQTLPLGNDGYLIQTTNDHLVIVGNGTRGTLYGVYGFLEDTLGCRWYAPDETVVPKHRTITLSSMVEIHRPAFDYREGWLYIGGARGTWWKNHYDADWVARNRMNGGRPIHLDDRHGGSITEGPMHSLASIVVPIGEYGKTHPEYYALVKGERTVSSDCQVCMSSPDVIRVATKHVRERMRQMPDAELIWITQGDNSNFCECDPCKALYARYGGWDAALDQPLPADAPPQWQDGYGGLAGALLYFVNRIAENLEDEFPERRIATFAYQPTRRPPRGIVPHRNVVVWYCAIERCHCHPLDRGPTSGLFYHHAAELATWTRLARTVYVYEYMGNGVSPDLLNLADDVRLYRNLGVKGATCDAIPEAHTGLGYLRFYLWMKLLWNPDYDVPRGISEFLSAYYGAAAPYLRDFIDLQDRHESWLRFDSAKLTPWTEDVVNPVPASRFRDCKLGGLSRRALEDAAELFRRAEAAVADDAQRRDRVAAARMPLDQAFIESSELAPDHPSKQAAVERYFRRAEKLGLKGISVYKTMATYRSEVYERLGLPLP